jgi:hypothetical protein
MIIKNFFNYFHLIQLLPLSHCPYDLTDKIPPKIVVNSLVSAGEK